MALPVVKSAVECADYFSTVHPYLYQFESLPGLVWEAIADPVALKQLYLDTNPLVSAFAFALATAPIFLVASEINKNYSQVDRFWSILPTTWIAHYAVWAHLSGFATGRLDAALVAGLIWSTRLTYNYWRRGGYEVGSEDYRWVLVQNYCGQPLFFLLNVVFIATAQPVLLCMITMPVYVLLLVSRLDTASDVAALQTYDVVGAGAMVALVALTMVGDQQQWNFQNAKYKYRETARVPPDSGFTAEQFDLGFRTTGLFAYSRHPNYAAEQAFWVTLYMWSCVTTGSYFNWSGVGALAYLILFQASTFITEEISAGKYPEYREYQKQVGEFVPNIGAKPPAIKNRSSNPPKNQKKAIDSPAAEKNAADYAQAKKRYDLR